MFRKFTHAFVPVALLTLIFLFLTLSPVYAADQVVTNCSNDTDLRNKLNALQSTGGGMLTFNCGVATIVLTSVLSAITADVTIDGGGKITLSGANSSRHFVVNSGARL